MFCDYTILLCIGSFFFLVYQIAILECNELDTNYFFDCFAGFQGIVFFLKRNNDLNCEIPMSIMCQTWKLLTPKHEHIFGNIIPGVNVKNNPW